MEQLIEAIKSNDLKKVNSEINKVDINGTFKVRGEEIGHWEKDKIIEITPLYYASFKGYVEIVQIFLNYGVDINKGWIDVRATPLGVAGLNGHLGVVKLLIENGADINKSTNIGWTPLNSAVYKGHLEVVKLLIENGADISKDCNKDVVKKAMNMQWTPKIHHLYSKKCRTEITITMMLAKKNTQLTRIPKEILLHICMFVTEQHQTTSFYEPVKKKQKLDHS